MLFKVFIDVNMALVDMENIIVMSMNLMQSLGAKDAINEDAKVSLTLWRCQDINDALWICKATNK